MPPNKGERIDLYAKGIGGAKVGEALTFLKIVFSVFRALSLLFIIIIVGLLIWQLLMIYFSDTSSANVSTIGTMSFALLGVTLGLFVIQLLGFTYLASYFEPISTYVYQKSVEPGLKT